METAWIVQTTVPHYRIPVFSELSARVPNLVVLSGDQYFTPGLLNQSRSFTWSRRATNRFLLSRRLLWQSNVVFVAKGDGVVIVELNPRILSTWVLLLFRKCQGKQTFVWGHLGSAKDTRTFVGRVRRLMMCLSCGFVAYTKSDAVAYKAIDPELPTWVLNNSCISKSDCCFDAEGERRNFIYVGRLVSAKKVGLLIEGFARALHALPLESKLIIIGDGVELDFLKARTEALGILGRVRFEGHVSDTEQLRRIYSTVVAAASPGYVGLSVIQSFAFGVPVLVAKNEPHSPEIEACAEGLNSVYFESDSEECLASRILAVWNDRAEWHAKGPSISNAIRSRYTIESMVDTFAAIFDQKTRV